MISKDKREKWEHGFGNILGKYNVKIKNFELKLEDLLMHKGKIISVCDLTLTDEEFEKLYTSSRTVLLRYAYSSHDGTYLLISAEKDKDIEGVVHLKYADITEYWNSMSECAQDYIVAVGKFIRSKIIAENKEFNIKYVDKFIDLWVEDSLTFDDFDNFAQECEEKCKGFDVLFVNAVKNGYVYKLITYYNQDMEENTND